MIEFDQSALDKFPEILKAASSMPPEVGKTLISSLDFLSNYNNGKCVVKLYSDFALLSLAFTISRDGDMLFNGGLIYQGPGVPADGSFPSLTVSLDNKVGWFIHT